MAFETSKFDKLYGKLLGKGINQTLAKQLASTLYRLSENSDVSIDEMTRNITNNGIKFGEEIYTSLNRYRTNSSQIGYLDPDFLPDRIMQQIPVMPECVPEYYVEAGYLASGYFEDICPPPCIPQEYVESGYVTAGYFADGCEPDCIPQDYVESGYIASGYFDDNCIGDKYVVTGYVAPEYFGQS